MLKGRKQSDTYLATICRYHWSVQVCFSQQFCILQKLKFLFNLPMWGYHCHSSIDISKSYYSQNLVLHCLQILIRLGDESTHWGSIFFFPIGLSLSQHSQQVLLGLENFVVTTKGLQERKTQPLNGMTVERYVIKMN